MQIWIDSAKIGDIKKVIDIGICSGCTTNPSLLKEAVDELAKKGETISMETYISDLCRTLGPENPVSLEVIGKTADEMIREAKILFEKFHSIAGNVVIKIPIDTYSTPGDSHYEGIKAINYLVLHRREGEHVSHRIRTNATLVMTPEQAVLAQNATYVSPFAGRVDDYLREGLLQSDIDDYNREFSHNQLFGLNKADYFPEKGINKQDNGIVSGVDLVKKILKIYKNYNISTKVIAASIRNIRQAREVMEAGTHIATIPPKVIDDLVMHKKTTEGFNKFSDDVPTSYKLLFTKK